MYIKPVAYAALMIIVSSEDVFSPGVNLYLKSMHGKRQNCFRLLCDIVISEHKHLLILQRV